MEKIAILELKSDQICLNFANVQKNKSYMVYKEYTMPVKVTKDLEKDGLIKPLIIKEIISILSVFKDMCDKEEVSDYICIAASILKEAKNINGFLNEVLSTTNFRFAILTPEERINHIYTTVINSFNKPKGLIINISEYTTELMLYNRRNVLETVILPYGSVNLSDRFVVGENGDEECSNMEKEIVSAVAGLDWLSNMEDDFYVIGAGRIFLDLGIISRKARRYPIEVEHNYSISGDDFDKVYNLIKPLDLSKLGKIKGVNTSPKQLAGGFSIIAAIFGKVNKEELSVSRFGEKEGLLLTYALPITLEKPLSDHLGFSLQQINDSYDRKPNNSEKVYDLSMILFKQLKVLHKLNRSYVRVLRVASYLHNVGYRVDYQKLEQSGFDIIMNSDIYGLTHSELVLAAFTVLLTNPDNFSPALWTRYKDIITNEDLEAVRKLAMILCVAKSLDITENSYITDITCDILGDSVIMKTIANQGVDFEVKHAMRWGVEFKKAFGKNLEIL